MDPIFPIQRRSGVGTLEEGQGGRKGGRECEVEIDVRVGGRNGVRIVHER